MVPGNCKACPTASLWAPTTWLTHSTDFEVVINTLPFSLEFDVTDLTGQCE